MAKKKLLEQPTRFQLIAEKTLCILAVLLGTLHLLLTAARYNFDYYTYARPFECWFALGLLVLALAYLVYCLVAKRKTMYRFKQLLKRLLSFDTIFSWGLILWFPLSCIVNQAAFGYNLLKTSDFWMLDTAVNCLILFTLPAFCGEQKSKKIMEYMMHAVMAFGTVFSVYCLIQLFRLNVVTMPSGYGIGMSAQMQFTIGMHYNITGAMAATMMCIAIYMMCTQKLVLRCVYTLAMLVHLAVLLLTNSRAAFVAGLVAIMASAFLASYHLFKWKDRKTQIGVSLLAALIAGGIVWVLRSQVFVWFDKATNFRAIIAASKSSSSSAAAAATVSGSAADSVRQLTDLSGRVNIWLASFKVMFYNVRTFFFGMSPALVSAALQQIGGINFEVAHAHNIILQFGVAFGVPVMIAFVAFLVSIAVKCIRIIFPKADQHFRGAFTIPVSILMLVVLNMAEAYLIAYFSIMSSVFFLFCGWASANGKQ